MSSLWTPSGEHEPEPEPNSGPDGAGPGAGPDGGGPEGRTEISQHEVEEFLRFQAEITSVPATDVVANHAFGLQQLAMMHLMQVPGPDGTVTEPRLDEAGVAIDALSAIVDALGDRLGQHRDVLTQAVTELRLAFVEISSPR